VIRSGRGLFDSNTGQDTKGASFAAVLNLLRIPNRVFSSVSRSPPVPSSGFRHDEKEREERRENRSIWKRRLVLPNPT
jgi:hypothetical protein